MWGERETTSDHLQTIYVNTLIKMLKCMQTPDKDSIMYYAIVTVITQISSSLLYSIVSFVLSNTSFKLTTYRLSRSTPVDSVAC